MKKALLFLLLALSLFSCSSDELVHNSQGTPMDVTFEQLSYNTPLKTRATMSGVKILWEEGDKFTLNYDNGSALYTRTNGKFYTTSLIKNAPSYSAFYSSLLVKTYTDGKYNITIPSTQYVKDGDIVGSSLLFTGTTTSTSSLNLKLACGVVDMSFEGLNANITKLEVESNQNISGAATVDPTNYNLNVTGSKNLTISGTITKESAHCMIVLPVGNHVLTLKATSNGETVTKKHVVNIQRAKVTKSSINLSFNKSSDENVILLNEGNWQSDNGQVSYIHNHTITNEWFRNINGTKIGDTPQDILYIPSKNLLAISVNWSNIVYFITTEGKLVAQTENVPNCRALATDGNYLYVTSYAHEAADGNTYEGGYVAKIDLNTYEVVQTYGVGYEPEGIAYYNGKLYVANTGGYAFQEDHGYEHSVSVIDLITGNSQKIDITDDNGNNVINLYGEMSQSGPYLCINSPGDYNSIAPATVIYDCRDNSYKVFSNIPCTYNTVTTKGDFFTVGSSFSYGTGSYTYYVNTINPTTKEIIEGFTNSTGSLVPNVKSTIESMQNPYCAYINPYTGHLYVTDAASYASSGKVYEFDQNGNTVGDPLNCYINPGHMCAINVLATRSIMSQKKQAPHLIKPKKNLNPNRHISINEFYKRK